MLFLRCELVCFQNQSLYVTFAIFGKNIQAPLCTEITLILIDIRLPFVIPYTLTVLYFVYIYIFYMYYRIAYIEY